MNNTEEYTLFPSPFSYRISTRPNIRRTKSSKKNKKSR
jgi:hypothetical protein